MAQFVTTTRIAHCVGDEPVVLLPNTPVTQVALGSFFSDYLASGAIRPVEDQVKSVPKKKDTVP